MADNLQDQVNILKGKESELTERQQELEGQILELTSTIETLTKEKQDLEQKYNDQGNLGKLTLEEKVEKIQSLTEEKK